MTGLFVLLAVSAVGCGRFGSPEQRGQQMLKRGEYAGAVDAYTEAIEAGRDLASAYAWRCYANLSLGHSEQAVADCTEALGLIEDGADVPVERWELLNNRGVAYLDLARTAEAEADLTEATALKPDYAQAYANLGRMRVDQQDHEAGIADLDRAIEIDPDLAEAYGNRGLAWEGLGDDEKALADYDAAIKKGGDAQAYFNRAMLQYTLGRFDEAYDDFKAIVDGDLEPDSYLRFMAQQQLDLLANRPTEAPGSEP